MAHPGYGSQYPQQGAPGAPGAPGGYPPQGAPGGYPQPGYQSGAPGGYPPQGAPGGYPQQGAPGGYPQQGAPGGYPQQGAAPGGYPQQGAAPGGYPQQQQGYGSQPAGQKPVNPAAQQYYSQIPPSEIATLQQSFYQVDTDRSGTITAQELTRLTLGSLKGFTLETAKKLIKVFDTDGSGHVSFYEYASLHRFVITLQQAFAAFDKDRSGTLELHETVQALQQGGFYVGQQTATKVFKRFASAPSGIKFEDFVLMCAFLGQVRSLFYTADTDRDGWIHLNLEGFMDLTSNF